jgi:hypothetical protein
MKFRFLFLFILCPFLVNAQLLLNDSTLNLYARWEKGEIANFTYRQTRERYVDGILKSYDSYLSTIQLKVLRSNARMKKVRWSYANIESEVPKKSALLNDLASIALGTKVIYKTDENGVFKELTNWKQVRKVVYKSLDRIQQTYQNEFVDSMVLASKELYATKESIEKLVISDIQLLHTIYGNEFVLRRKEAIPTTLPNLNGGDDLPAVLNFELIELNKKKKFAKVILRQYIDTKSAIMQLNPEISNPNKDMMVNSFPHIKDYNEFDIELKLGWITRALYIREVVDGNVRSVDTYELKKL